MTVREIPSLEELYGWMYDEDDNPPIITEADIDVAAEIAAADEDAEYAAADSCSCRGRDWSCSCYGRVA